MLTQSTEDGGGVHVGPGTAVSSLAVAGCLLHGCGDLVFFGTTSIAAVNYDGFEKCQDDFNGNDGIMCSGSCGTSTQSAF